MSDDTLPPLAAEFLLDPDVVFLNHGSFGACPRAVFARYQQWQLELERRPVEFLGRRIDDLLADARRELGDYIGADPTDLVFVPNVSSAVNVVARALELQPGDEVLATDLEYGALDLMWEHLAARSGARYVRAPVRLPVESSAEIAEAVWNGVGPRTRVLFLSHVTSSTALRLPVEELCGRAREAGIVTIIDGAHAPGQIPLDLGAVRADYYGGNCHKWLCAPKGSAFLYVRRELQKEIHPFVVGWGYGGDAPFLSRHEQQGTRDPSAYLTAPDAIRWQAEHDWDTVRARCHELARAARSDLGLEPIAADSDELYGQMVALRLPTDAPANLQARLYDEHRIEVPVTGGLLRVSFQGYNTASDLGRLREALAALLPTRAAA